MIKSREAVVIMNVYIVYAALLILPWIVHLLNWVTQICSYNFDIMLANALSKSETEVLHNLLNVRRCKQWTTNCFEVKWEDVKSMSRAQYNSLLQFCLAHFHNSALFLYPDNLLSN